MALDPIRLGSANSTDFTLETYTVTTSDNAIQTADAQGLFVSTFGVFVNLPANGTPFNGVFANGGLPNDFLLDYSEGGPQIDLLQGEVVRLHFKFKRPDPNATGATASRKVYVDSIINYQLSPFLAGLFFAPVATVTGETFSSTIGFPEPLVTVKYNSLTKPTLPAGLYALPGDPKVAGFPVVADVSIRQQFIIPAGTTIFYLDNDILSPPNLVQVTISVATTFTYDFIFSACPTGWQMTRLKYDPLSADNFYDVEETWRNFYVFKGISFVSRVPP